MARILVIWANRDTYSVMMARFQSFGMYLGCIPMFSQVFGFIECGTTSPKYAKDMQNYIIEHYIIIYIYMQILTKLAFFV